jgi:hypothetical protein
MDVIILSGGGWPIRGVTWTCGKRAFFLSIVLVCLSR